eukprot:1237742-Pyramimonas_sp.AAC.1
MVANSAPTNGATPKAADDSATAAPAANPTMAKSATASPAPTPTVDKSIVLKNLFSAPPADVN